MENGWLVGVGSLVITCLGNTLATRLGIPKEGYQIIMNTNTRNLHQNGVSLWLDNITRGLLKSGTLEKYIRELSVTGLTSNPTIFDHAIANTDDYDEAILQKIDKGVSDEALFFELAIEDLSRAADLFRPVYERTNGVDGWVSLEVSPLLAYDTDSTIQAAKKLYEQAGQPNLFIKIPGTPQGLPAIEQSIFAGVPVNVTLLFSAEQYTAAANAYLRGIERRIAAGLNPDVRSVASLFISRWDKATMGKVPAKLQNKLGLAVAQRAYMTYREFLISERMLRAMNFGAQPQRLLWASTGTKDPQASDILYIRALVAPYTINTMPEKTLLAFADHGEIETSLSLESGTSDQVIADFEKAGVSYEELAEKLQKDGAAAFVKSWNDLLATIKSKSTINA
jgi:transaldolase